MTNDIEDNPFIKMRKQFVKEKDVIVARYEAVIKEKNERIAELESRDSDNIVDVSPEDIGEPFFDVENN